MRLRLIAVTLILVACAGPRRRIAGTPIEDTDENRRILGVVEKYRMAVERKDVAALMAMASKQYWEDGGTPTGADDYGYDGLREVLKTRFQAADAIRYSLKYVRIRRQQNRAFIDVLIDASYTIQTHRGEERLDMKDQNEIVLEWDGERWLFLSGM